MSRVTLPNGDWADLADRLNYAQALRIQKARGTPEAAGTLVAALVTGWSVRDVDGANLPFPGRGPEGIPLPSLDLLPWDTFEAIGTAAADVLAGEPDPKGTTGASAGSPPVPASGSNGTSPTPTSSPSIPAGAGAT